MTGRRSPFARRLAAVFALALAGCGSLPPQPASADVAPADLRARTTTDAAQRQLPGQALDPALAERILALDPERVSDRDVRETLARGPTPHIVLLHGGIFPVYLAMVSFGEFLTGMGYPEASIRHPGDGRWSHSPYEPSEQITGLVAWYYEHDGVRPMMVGHSQGGVQAVKVLRDLVGQFAPSIPVWDPLTDSAQARTTIVDPLTGQERPVVGLSVSYVSVVGAGGAALLLPNQWNMIGYVHTVPDSAVDFTGYSLGLDLIAWTGPGSSDFRHNGTARVRNVTLPATYNHVSLPVTARLAERPEVRQWVNDYRPNAALADAPADEGYALLWAADNWYEIKRSWVLEAQRYVRAQQARAAR